MKLRISAANIRIAAAAAAAVLMLQLCLIAFYVVLFLLLIFFSGCTRRCYYYPRRYILKFMMFPLVCVSAPGTLSECILLAAMKAKKKAAAAAKQRKTKSNQKKKRRNSKLTAINVHQETTIYFIFGCFPCARAHTRLSDEINKHNSLNSFENW